MALRIPHSLLENLWQHGEESYPHECHGVLLGYYDFPLTTVEGVARFDAAQNDLKGERYQIDPEELTRIQREAHERDMDVVGFYVSHPDGAARWTTQDLKEAHWTGCSYLILSIEKGSGAEANCFLLREDGRGKHFEDEALTVTRDGR
jgi:proteasome lid subunit RPN8/RPN11